MNLYKDSITFTCSIITCQYKSLFTTASIWSFCVVAYLMTVIINFTFIYIWNLNRGDTLNTNIYQWKRRETVCFDQANCIKSQKVSLKGFLRYFEWLKLSNIGKAFAWPALLVLLPEVLLLYLWDDTINLTLIVTLTLCFL